jgi:hypothetical protein
MLNRINEVSLDQRREREPDELYGLLVHPSFRVH